MFSDENKSASLAKQLLCFDYVIVDTCSLMEDAFPAWADQLVAAKSYLDKHHIYIPYRCYQELKKHSHDRRDVEKRIAAKRAIKIIRKIKWKKLIQIAKKKKEDNFADNAIYVNVSANRLSSRILIITQDKKLATDLKNLNLLQSQAGRRVEVLKLIPGGILVPNRGEDVHYQEKRATRTQKPEQQKSKPNSTQGPLLVLTDFEAKIVSDDKRLSAVLTNPTYSQEKKVADINLQLSNLSKLSPSRKAQLSLLLNEDKLKVHLKTLHVAVTEKKTVTPAVPSQEKRPNSTAFYADSTSLREALESAALHFGLMFRYHTIPHNPQFHGKIDLTDEDLLAIINNIDESLDGTRRVSITYKGMIIAVEPRSGGYRVWLTPPEDKPVKPSPEKKEEAPKPAEKPAPKKKATVKAKKEEKPAEEAKPAPKKAEPKTTAKKAEAKPAERPAAKKAVKAKAAPAEEKKPSPAPKKVVKAKPATEKKEKAKPVEKPAAAPVAKASKSDAQKAATYDRRLRSSLPNPTYGSEEKIKALKKQIELVSKLSEEEQKSLFYKLSDLKEELSKAETNGK